MGRRSRRGLVRLMSLLNERIYDTILGIEGSPLDRIRRLFHESLTHFNSSHTVFTFESEGNAYSFTSPFADAYFNQVTIYDGDSDNLESALKPFYLRNCIHSVFLGGAALVHAEKLKARGYIMRAATPLMAYALDPQVDVHQLSTGLQVRRVESQVDLELAQRLLVSGFGLSEEIASASSQALFKDPDSYRYLLLADGVPVSTMHFVRTKTFLACFDVTTPAVHQRNGYANELMNWALARHAAMGDELVVLLASESGQPLYRRLGFQVLEYLQGWFMEDTFRMNRFTHETLNVGGYVLRLVQESDEEILVPLYNDPEISRWTPVPHPYTSVEFKSYFRRSRYMLRNGTGIDWMIERDGVLLGAIGCHNTDWEAQRTEIGYLIFAPFRGQGIMPNILRELTNFLFDTYQFVRIEVLTDVRNLGSRKTALKAGFTLDGESRKKFLIHGELTDDAIYSKINDKHLEIP